MYFINIHHSRHNVKISITLTLNSKCATFMNCHISKCEINRNWLSQTVYKRCEFVKESGLQIIPTAIET